MSLELIEKLTKNLGMVIRGKDDRIKMLLTAFLAGGNVLLNDVPGVGKTSLAKAIAASMHGIFHRIQFTPDLLPSDIIGGSVYNPKEGNFGLHRGPVFANILLADEINRASPRTQSSLLEAMAEGNVSIEGKTHKLPEPFWVIATQNPVEYHGTYPLPEAQLDRFTIQMEMGYPAHEYECEILSSQNKQHPLETLEAVTTAEEVIKAQADIRDVHVDEDVSRYIVDIITATRSDPRIQLGASPRAAIALYRMSQSHAYIRGAAEVFPDDVKAIAVETLAHRLILETKAKYSGADKKTLVKEIIGSVKVPV